MLRTIANFLSTIIVSPLVVTLWLSSRAGCRRTFATHCEILSIIPGMFGVLLRRAFFRQCLTSCSDSVIISFGTLLSHQNSKFGHHVYVGPYGCIGEVEIGDDVLIGSHVSIPNGGKQHGIDRLDIPVREQQGEWCRMHIGNDSWIGDRAIVMADIGKHCVVGAGAVVTRQVEDYAIVVGCPAKVVGFRKQQAEEQG